LYNGLDQWSIDYPDDSEIDCEMRYDVKRSDPLIMRVTNKYDYEYNQLKNRIEKVALDTSEQHASMLLLKPGIENTLIQRVSEISENFVMSSGQFHSAFRFY
jgi:hypothetical protein